MVSPIHIMHNMQEHTSQVFKQKFRHHLRFLDNGLCVHELIYRWSSQYADL